MQSGRSNTGAESSACLRRGDDHHGELARTPGRSASAMRLLLAPFASTPDPCRTSERHTSSSQRRRLELVSHATRCRSGGLVKIGRTRRGDQMQQGSKMIPRRDRRRFSWKRPVFRTSSDTPSYPSHYQRPHPRSGRRAQPAIVRAGGPQRRRCARGDAVGNAVQVREWTRLLSPGGRRATRTWVVRQRSGRGLKVRYTARTDEEAMRRRRPRLPPGTPAWRSRLRARERS